MIIPSEALQKRIVDTIRYRFYNRLDLYDVYRWLNNFTDDEQELAVSVFEQLMYYREEDLLSILKDKLYDVMKDAFEELQRCVHLRFVPLGKPGKSGHAIQYLVKNLLKTGNTRFTKQVTYYSHPKDVDVSKLTGDDVVVFLDDIIGSGDTFVGAVSTTVTKTKKDGTRHDVPNEWTIGHIVKADAPYKIVLLSCIIIDKGEKRLKAEFPFMRQYGDVKIHAFSKGESPFGGYMKMKQVREFCYKYGQMISPGRELGYSNSQALVMFAHAVPNNTLPIVWACEYQENGQKKKWQPLIPRDQMKKQELAYLKRMDNNRWVFKLSHYFGVDQDDQNWKGLINAKSYNLIWLLRCMDKKMPEVVIANEMGLTHDDMEKLYDEGAKLGMWDSGHRVTDDARKALEDVGKRLNIEARNNKRFLQVDDRDYMYIPETFRGKS